ncbi:RAMP superfamily CRISPR-associated protein, partial [Geminocystis sp. CENA526]|uniref:RAMP superfamily CRISPR-associated protein n=1 Tax=Geminocystis sp. CENA526 TaxID=1355871 RepID=UPI003D6E0281
MARKIHSRYKITGNLITISPIHIGGVGGNADTDMALAVNGEGKFYLPATSLAGALRAYMATFNPDITDKIWGFQEAKGDNGYASFVIVEDAVINSAIVEIRDGVAIDRYSGTAAEGMKFDRAILPKGVTIPISLTLERDAKLSDGEWQDYQNAFAQLITALEEGEIYLGGAKSRGLGRVKLYDTRIIEEDLLTPTGILGILNNQQKIVNWSKIYASGENCQNKLEITIKWTPVGAVMVKSEGDGMTVDILPLVSGKGGGLTFVIPGSSLKGVWRSQAERIIRTVCNHSLTLDDDFNQQVTLELIKTLFGTPAELDENQKQLGYLSCLAVDDCFANIPMASHQWASITDATKDSSLRNSLDSMGLQDTQLGYHVGIDRWIGSAAEGFLYTTLEPFGVNWENIEISLNLH